MKEHNEVRRLYFIEGQSMRAIARETGFHRLTVKRIVSEGGPPQYSRPCKPKRPVLDPYTVIIDEMLKQDVQFPRKQRHTDQRVFNRLKEEHDYSRGQSAPTRP